jgi:hypothetical protein
MCYESHIPLLHVNLNKLQETQEHIFVRGKNKNICIDTLKQR